MTDRESIIGSEGGNLKWTTILPGLIQSGSFLIVLGITFTSKQLNLTSQIGVGDGYEIKAMEQLMAKKCAQKVLAVYQHG
eukprot:g6179.t1